LDILSLIGRDKRLFDTDIDNNKAELEEIVSNSRFLVLGGAGTIGQATAKEIFKRNPKKLHVVDISENNLVEFVRDVRSSYGYIDGEFKTFALDIGSLQYDAFIKSDGQYDYVLNLSALKHVRSEKDPFTLMRMIEVNILNTIKTIDQSIKSGVKKYFCVSTDKAANPVNMMGASKRIMELYLLQKGKQIHISTARFANVAFSDGSLLHGFNQRIAKNQPIVAPNDIRRYFVIPPESGELCLMSCIFGENGDIFFPKLSEDLHLITFAEIAEKYLAAMGMKPLLCETEDDARSSVSLTNGDDQWPCLFTKSDTTGEKDLVEFFTQNEVIDLDRFDNLGIVKNNHDVNEELLVKFLTVIKTLRENREWSKEEIVDLFHLMIPGFAHKETGKYLDAKM
jgi:FlaA1/EpsC-like NDP-sugar epimerase